MDTVKHSQEASAPAAPTGTHATAHAPHAPKAKPVAWYKTGAAAKAFIVVGAAAVIGAGVWWFYFRPYVKTDDARVAMTLVRVAPWGVTARIQKINVDEGSKVKAGDVLVELDNRVAQANYDKAKARLDFTKREQARLQRLVAESSATQQALETAISNQGTAEADMKLAEVNLENTTLKAPFDGVVVQKISEVGNLIEPGQTAVVVADEAHAWVSANIEETSSGELKVGQPVRISIDEGGEAEGEVLEIRSAVASQFALIPSDNGAGNFTKVVQRIPIKIALKPPFPALRAGQSVEVSIKVH